MILGLISFLIGLVFIIPSLITLLFSRRVNDYNVELSELRIKYFGTDPIIGPLNRINNRIIKSNFPLVLRRVISMLFILLGLIFVRWGILSFVK